MSRQRQHPHPYAHLLGTQPAMPPIHPQESAVAAMNRALNSGFFDPTNAVYQAMNTGFQQTSASPPPSSQPSGRYWYRPPPSTQPHEQSTPPPSQPRNRPQQSGKSVF